MITNMPQLSPDVVQNLKAAERKLHDVLPVLQAAKDCGMDVSTLEQTRDDMLRQIDAFKRNFFNGDIGYTR